MIFLFELPVYPDAKEILPISGKPYEGEYMEPILQVLEIFLFPISLGMIGSLISQV